MHLHFLQRVFHQQKYRARVSGSSCNGLPRFGADTDNPTDDAAWNHHNHSLPDSALNADRFLHLPVPAFVHHRQAWLLYASGRPEFLPTGNAYLPLLRCVCVHHPGHLPIFSLSHRENYTLHPFSAELSVEIPVNQLRLHAESSHNHHDNGRVPLPYDPAEHCGHFRTR